jgi:hypothetical protein
MKYICIFKAFGVIIGHPAWAEPCMHNLYQVMTSALKWLTGTQFYQLTPIGQSSLVEGQQERRQIFIPQVKKQTSPGPPTTVRSADLRVHMYLCTILQSFRSLESVVTKHAMQMDNGNHRQSLSSVTLENRSNQKLGYNVMYPY